MEPRSRKERTGSDARKRTAAATIRARALRKGDNMAEALLWNELKARGLGGFKFVRQFPIGPYFADFLNRERKLVVEVDGSHHAGSEYDETRNAFMRAQGYSVLRFWSHDVIKGRNDVCETILAVLEDRLSENVRTSDLRFIKADDV